MAYKFKPVTKREIGTSLSEINVTPLVDVMLVLLIIFMVTAPLMQSGIGVNLPQAETVSAPAEEGLTLTITKDRYIHIEDSAINQFLLEQKLKEYFFGKEKKVVFLRADESLNYGFVIHIMDIIKKAGVEALGLVSEPLEPNKKR
ncbi:MAG: biopolymer transporter ExbD [Candidatus Aminicenantes bacterium]|nr:MAG: biopolymer transporter ExbD [Candidatus Aminicenantes bacterium]